MSKYLLIAAAILFATGMAMAADAPPPHGTAPGGWGHDCTTWTTYSGAYAQTSACLTEAGTFIDCSNGLAVVWPGLDIEVWVEAMCWFSWANTAAQVHVASTEGPQDICIHFIGANSCNIPVNINTEAPGGGTLDFIPYVHGVGGWNSGGLGGNLEASWSYSVDGVPGSYGTQTGGVRTFYLPECQHNLDIQCCLHFDNHQKAGYYHLTGGSICPANPL